MYKRQSQYADLSHFLFGICENIKEKDIAEITVSINGDPQTVVWGENVEIKTQDKPDNPTGCIGLKFDFPLNKVLGIMRVDVYKRQVLRSSHRVCLRSKYVLHAPKAVSYTHLDVYKRQVFCCQKMGGLDEYKWLR